MYDWEIKNYLDEHNYVLNHKEYIQMCNSSPQIDHIKYESFENCFCLWTREGNSFKIQVYYAE